MTTCTKASLPSSIVFVGEYFDVIICNGLSVQLELVVVLLGQGQFAVPDRESIPQS